MASGTEVGKIYYELDLDNDKFKRGINDSSSSADNFGNKLQDIGKKAAVAFAAIGAGAIAFGVSSVKAFNESAQGIAQTEAVLKSTGNAAGVTAAQVTKLASALQRTTTFSDEEVRSAENLLLTFTAIGQDIFPEATSTVLDMATALGTDAKSASIQLGKALQDPILGITALRRVGVNFNKEQQEVIANLVNTGRSAEAQRLILAELNREFGGSAAAAAGTYAGKMKQLQNNFNDLQEQIGGMIVNALLPATKALGDWIAKVTEAGGLLPYFGKLIHDNQMLVAGLAGAIFPFLILALDAMAASIYVALAPLIPFIAAGVALGLLINNLAVSMGGWGKLWDGLVYSVRNLWGTVVGFLTPSLTTLWNTIQTQLWPAVQRLWQTLEPGFTTALKAVAVFAGAVLVSAIWVLVNVLTVASETLGRVAAAVSNVIQWFINLYNWVGSVVAQFRNGMFNISTVVGNAWVNIRYQFGQAMQNISDSITGFFSTFYNSGIRLVQSLGRGIADGVMYAVNAAKNVLSRVRDLLPFSDAKKGPLSDLTLSGQRFSQTFAAGILQGAGAIRDAASQALDLTTPGFGGSMGSGVDNSSSISNQIGTININRDADADAVLRKLTRSDQLISMGLSG